MPDLTQRPRFPGTRAGATAGRVVAALEEDIIFGRMSPRERLVEDALAARFEVKRHVVRQALSELDRLGIVTRTLNKGAVVRDFSEAEVTHIYDMREKLQRWAAEAIPLPAPPELIGRLREIHRRHAQAVAEDGLRAVFHLNNQLHETLFGACGNPYLAEAINHFAWMSHAIRSYRMADPDLLRQAVAEHAAMIDAMQAGDREALVRLCVDHIKPSRDAYLQAIRMRRQGETAESAATPG